MSSRHLVIERIPSQNLTGREYEVLSLLAVGHPMKRIAYRLGISYRTVTFHKYKIMERLGVATNADLVRYALQNNIFASPVPTKFDTAKSNSTSRGCQDLGRF